MTELSKARNNDMVRGAVAMVANELKNNRDFRLSWQVSIAQSMLDADTHGKGKTFEHCAHAGANNFISKLVGEPLEVIG